MSHTRDDAGNIRELHTKASSLSHNAGDVSGGASTTQPALSDRWRRKPTPIQNSGNRSSSNPYSRRITVRNARQIESRAGSSSAPKSLRPPSKRQKRDHPQEKSVSKYFDEPSRRRGSRAIPSTSTSSHSSRPSTDAIIIDVEDDTPATNDHPHEPILLRTSSPGPLDVISPEVPYDFDQNKPSPISALSSSLEEIRKPPGDGQSTLRVRSVMKGVDARTAASISRTDGDDDDARTANALPTLLSRGESSAQAKVSSGRGNAKKKVLLFEPENLDNPHYGLNGIRRSTRRLGVIIEEYPSRRDIPPLPIQHLDPDATRPSGFTSGLKPSKGKATGSNISLHLPLKEWAIGPAILPSQEATPQLVVQLVWESRVLKVRDANGSIPFELQVQKGSIDSIKYVDVKGTTTSEPLVQIRPSLLANAQNRTAFRFKPGSSDPEGFLTFKFDTSASDWDNDVYLGLVEKLLESLDVKILDGPAARAVWEAATRGNENTSTMSEPEPTALDVPKENPPNPPSKPPPPPRFKSSSATATTDTSVRRSVRLSWVEEKRFSPKPDPDEVHAVYLS